MVTFVLLALLLTTCICLEEVASRCHSVSRKYTPSSSEVQHLNTNAAWDADYCGALSASGLEDWLVQGNQQFIKDKTASKNLSYFTTIQACGTHMRNQIEFIEPLAGILRHPSAISCPSLQISPTLMSLDYLLLAKGSHAAHASPIKVLFDLGASNYSSLSQQPLLELYERSGIRFDRHLMWEAAPMNSTTLFSHVPSSRLVSYQYFNIPAEANPASPRNPLNMLLRAFTPRDFVVLKLDIDNSALERAFINQILSNRNLQARIDEFFWEPHFNYPPLIDCCWFETANKGQSLNETLHIFSQLRQAGIRAHGWP